MTYLEYLKEDLKIKIKEFDGLIKQFNKIRRNYNKKPNDQNLQAWEEKNEEMVYKLGIIEHVRELIKKEEEEEQ